MGWVIIQERMWLTSEALVQKAGPFHTEELYERQLWVVNEIVVPSDV
jgi:hypothetical protein